ncbi:MAG TPA: phospholipase D-like domain-containing protein [Blastocatellia bacterium]|nr:phospholipase D-like domain-containing protein [Blastocatellia bacterium]
MSNYSPTGLSNQTPSRQQLLSERALSRTVGAPIVQGNSVRLLKDARENYPAWLEAISSARHKIYFESYIIHEDAQGELFAEALAAKAREGVRVRLIYDWLGGMWATSRRFWRRLREAGIEVRCFNPPRFSSPFGWLGRDHRKMIVVDGQVGFVTGLCVGQMWVGYPERGIAPWRDTGIEVRGPAVADIERSFAHMWAAAGPPLPPDELIEAGSIRPAGEVPVRVVGSVPNTAVLYRLDQMVAANANETLWLTDAYFAGTTPYVQALRAAAVDGVDVRLLVPQATDIPLMRSLSRSGYRPLLEAGVRVFEWNGPMIHAKTAVSDGAWARVGSTNLNLASWLGNWELDVVIEDEGFGQAMERMYLEDLQNSTEIVLSHRRRPSPVVSRRERPRQPGIVGSSGSGRAAAGAMRIGRVVSAALTNRRVLGPAEARIMFTAASMLFILGLLAIVWPRLISLPLGVLALWVAGSLLVRAYELYREGRRETAARRSESRIHEALSSPREGSAEDQ